MKIRRVEFVLGHRVDFFKNESLFSYYRHLPPSKIRDYHLDYSLGSLPPYYLPQVVVYEDKGEQYIIRNLLTGRLGRVRDNLIAYMFNFEEVKYNE